MQAKKEWEVREKALPLQEEDFLQGLLRSHLELAISIKIKELNKNGVSC